MSTFQCKLNRANPSSHSWDISRWSFYSYWWPDISIICCCFCTFHICADSPHLGLSSTTWFVKIGPLVVEIQAEWSLWHSSILIQYKILLDVVYILLSKIQWGFLEVQIVSYALSKNVKDRVGTIFGFNLYAMPLWVVLVIYFKRGLGKLRES